MHLRYSNEFCSTAGHLRYIHANLQLTMEEAKAQFKLGDLVSFKDFSYKGIVVGFAADKDGYYDGTTFPIKVKIDQEFAFGKDPMIAYYHHNQLVLDLRPEIGLALV